MIAGTTLDSVAALFSDKLCCNDERSQASAFVSDLKGAVNPWTEYGIGIVHGSVIVGGILTSQLPVLGGKTANRAVYLSTRARDHEAITEDDRGQRDNE